MADRDVKLIIRAKNEASRTIDSVADALKVLSQSQEKVTGSASKTNDTIGRLGDEMAKMNARVSGMQAMGKLADYLERAGGAVDRLKGGVSNAAASLENYGKQALEAANRIQTLEGQAAAMRSRIEGEKVAMDEARAATLKRSEAQKELTKARREYNNAIKVKEGTEGRDNRISEAKQRLDEATSAVERNKQAYEKLNTTYRNSKKELTGLEAGLRQSRNEQKQFESSAAGAAASLDRQKASLEQAKSEYGELDAKVKQAAAGFGIVETEQSQLAASTAKLVPELTRLGSLFASLQRYSTGTGKFVDPKTASQMRQLRLEAERVESTWRELEGEAKRLAGTMRGVAEPTAQQVAAFRDVVRAAAAAKAEYRQIQTSMHALQGTSRSTFAEFSKAQGPLAAVKGGIRQVTDETDELNAAMARYRTGTGSMADAKTASGMRQQAEAVGVARERWRTLQAEVARLDGVMRSSTGATAAQTARFREVSQAANLAEKEFRETEAALRRLNASGGSSLFAGINRESRQAMSVYQRIRGEVLALTTAYIGLYGIIGNMGGVIRAFQAVEAAQNRLGAVFEQDQGAVAKELQFLERMAARLGIQFGELADQYSKFAIAAKAANLTTEETRKVFQAVAEAGRVNKLSAENMNRVFVALQQMMSKGKIQAEELRQQLGDALPGAMNIMAEALGMTTAELDKMMEQGNVLANSSNMLKFADKLNEMFGPQLEQSLTSTTTMIGQFWNNIFQAQQRVGEGGFIESFNKLLKQMNEWFKSREGRDFFLSLGAVAGKFTDALALVAGNIKFVMDLMGGLVALKVAAWLTGVVNGAIAVARNMTTMAAASTTAATSQSVAAASTVRFGAALRTAVASVTSYGASLRTLSGIHAALNGVVTGTSAVLTTFTTRAGLAAASARVLAGASTILAGTMRVLSAAIAALGGPVGILITLGTIIGGNMLAKWAGGVNEATQALDEHRRILGEVASTYEQLGEKAKNWAKEIKNVTADQAAASFRQMNDAAVSARQDIGSRSIGDKARFSANIVGLGGIDAARQAEQIRALTERVNEGRVSLQEYIKRLEEIHRTARNNTLQRMAEDLLKQARAARDLEKGAGQAAAVLKAMGVAVEGMDAALRRAPASMDEVTKAAQTMGDAVEQARAQTEAYEAGIDGLRSKVPELAKADEMKKELAEIEQSFTNATAHINANIRSTSAEWARAVKMRDAAIAAVREKYVTPPNYEGQYTSTRARGGARDQELAELVTAVTQLSKQMGISAKDLLAVMSFETGGTLNKWQAGPRTQWGQHRGLIQWGEPQAAKYGVNANTSITAQVIAAGKYLTDAGVKAGDGLMQIYAAVLAGDARKVNAGDRRNGGVVDRVSTAVTGKQFAGHIARADGLLGAYAGVSAEAEKVFEAEVKANEERRKAKEATDESLSDMQAQNQLLELQLKGEHEKALIEENIARLRKQNPNISDEDVARATEMLKKRYEIQQAMQAEKEEAKRIREIEEQINTLEAHRNSLMAQRQTYQDQGNFEKVKEIEGQIVGIDQKLLTAIQAAIQFHQALGGPQADATIEKLKAMGLAIENADIGGKKFAMTAAEMGQNIYNSLSTGILNMFDKFARAIAEGEDALGALWGAFREFAANFLLEIAQMIIKQTLFNALQAVSKAMGGSLFGMFHSGGIVGAGGGGGRKKSVSPAWFNSAVRYHSGGIAGLAPDEVPAILRAGEEVLTESDPRHRNNGGTMPVQGGRTKVVNMFDAASFLSEALNSTVGEETLLNFVRANPSAFRAAMG